MSQEEEDPIFAETAISQDDVQRWARPRVPAGHLRKRPALQFETVDVKSTYVNPRDVQHLPSVACEGSSRIPRISVYGVTNEGHSICANVWNFSPYFYVRTGALYKDQKKIAGVAKRLQERIEAFLDAGRRFSRADWRREEEEQEEEEEMQEREAIELQKQEEAGQQGAGAHKRSALDAGLGSAPAGADRRRKATRRADPGPCVVAVEDCTHLIDGTDCLARPWSFFRVLLRTPNMVSQARDFVGSGKLPGIHPVTYESNVMFENRFMIDRGIAGAGWTEVTRGAYTVRTHDADKHSSCQIEVDLDWRSVRGLDILDEANASVYERPSKMRAISYDIECQGRPGRFPDSQEDPIIQIAAVGWTVGDGEAREECKVLFTLAGCDPISGTRVVCARTECDLIDNFATFLHYYDPDLIVGYNTKGFDDAYLFDRATILRSTRYLACGRDRDTELVKREDNRMSRNYGNRQGYNVNVVGRCGFDMLPHIKANKKLRSYTLNAVAAALLGDQKEDLHYSMISVLQAGDNADRRRLGIYCVKDVLLPKMLATKMLSIAGLMEFSRATGVQMRQIQDQGQSVKVMTNVLRNMRPRNMLMPYMPDQEKVEYEGANVFVPHAGFYTEPVVVLDFSALYPSLMIAHNICFSTHVPDSMLPRFGREQLERCPKGHHYLKREVRTGVLTAVLDGLLKQREASKKAMKRAKAEGDEARYDVYNCRQLAVKVQANSVYGWTGLSTSVYFWFCAESTTAYGREQIKLTQRLVEAKYTRANGYPFDAKVIYGDTDSVMIHLQIPVVGGDLVGHDPEVDKPFFTDAAKQAVATAIEYAHEIAAYCTEHFAPPNRLEFENVYLPYLLRPEKKRYAGPFWESAEGPSYDKVRGFESVRRDNCKAASEGQAELIRIILHEMDPDKAYRHACGLIKSLRENTLDLSQLVISQRLNARQYALNPQQARLIRQRARQARLRELGLARNVGQLSAATQMYLEGVENDAFKKACAEHGMYSTRLPHAELDRKMRKRSGMGYNIGDRVPYIIVDGGLGRKARNWEKAEDPITVLEQDMLPDLEYYTEKIAKAAAKVLAPVYEKKYTHQTMAEFLGRSSSPASGGGSGGAQKGFVRDVASTKTLTKRDFGDLTLEKLMHGPHMKRVNRHRRIGEDSAFKKLFREFPRCLRCREKIEDCPARTDAQNMPRVCPRCRPQTNEIYRDELSKYRRLGMEYSRLWTQCQNCQEDHQREISCNAISCPIFFRRTVVKRLFERQKGIIDGTDW